MMVRWLDERVILVSMNSVPRSKSSWKVLATRDKAYLRCVLDQDREIE